MLTIVLCNIYCITGHGKHNTIFSDACYRCWLSYLLSSAPVQGFEFEATMILNSAPFNIVEAMPVLPGPCQLLKWEVLRKHRVIDTYFKMLVSTETRNQHYTKDFEVRGSRFYYSF